ncbi:hypothetical protein JHJ32_19535 [Parapedobacter sp. ISTM3]|nr:MULTISPECIES: hypothetical protein [Parapedobacter]MBK1442198.1 hypothetical protein [Parapedobacter sp. ISTM3]
MKKQETNSEEYFFAQPLQVPANYDRDDRIDRQVVFSLADLGEGTAEEVAKHWASLDGSLSTDFCLEQSKRILTALYEKGLINGIGSERSRRFNLAKVTRPHSGRVDDI